MSEKGRGEGDTNWEKVSKHAQGTHQEAFKGRQEKNRKSFQEEGEALDKKDIDDLREQLRGKADKADKKIDDIYPSKRPNAEELDLDRRMRKGVRQMEEEDRRSRNTKRVLEAADKRSDGVFPNLRRRIKKWVIGGAILVGLGGAASEGADRQDEQNQGNSENNHELAINANPYTNAIAEIYQNPEEEDVVNEKINFEIENMRNEGYTESQIKEIINAAWELSKDSSR